MASELEFVPFKDFVESLPARTVAKSGDKTVVSNSTDGPGSETNAAQAQKVLSGNVVQEFDPSKPNDDNGVAYYAGEKVVFSGEVYSFKLNHASGAWNSAEVEKVNIDEYLTKSLIDLTKYPVMKFDDTIAGVWYDGIPSSHSNANCKVRIYVIPHDGYYAVRMLTNGSLSICTFNSSNIVQDVVSVPTRPGTGFKNVVALIKCLKGQRVGVSCWENSECVFQDCGEESPLGLAYKLDLNKIDFRDLAKDNYDFGSGSLNYIFNGYINTTTGEEIASSPWWTIEYKVIPGEKYTIKRAYYALRKKDKNHNLISVQPLTGGENYTYQNDDETYYVAVCANKNVVGNDFVGIKYYGDSEFMLVEPNSRGQCNYEYSERKLFQDSVNFNCDTIEFFGVKPKGNSKQNVVQNRDFWKFPFSSSFGGEYLAHYYNMAFASATFKIAFDGDSLTQNDRRLTAINNIYKNAGFWKVNSSGVYSKTYEYLNNGLGSQTTQEWIGTGETVVKAGRTIGPNGLLNDSMAYNPDLLIVSWGTNDPVGLTGTTEQKVKQYLDNMEEGLKRIRGNTPVNGRDAYNKSVYDLSIIVCVPPVTDNYQEARDYDQWHVYIRKGLMSLCRKYLCAYVDYSMFTMDCRSYGDLALCGDIGKSDYSVHPSYSFSSYYASVIQPLICPVAMWKNANAGVIPKFGLKINRPSTKEIDVGYRYYCTDTHKNIYCDSKGVAPYADFTVTNFSTYTQSDGYFALRIGNFYAVILFQYAVANRAIASGDAAKYVAKYIFEALCAQGVKCDYAGEDTIRVYSDIYETAESASYDNGVSSLRDPCYLDITANLVEPGSSNSWVDDSGVVV